MTITQFFENHADNGWYRTAEIGAEVGMADRYVDDRCDRLYREGVLERKHHFNGVAEVNKYRLAA